MSLSQSPPGLIYPTMKSYPQGANSPAEAAHLNMVSANQRHANLSSSVGGKKTKKYKGGTQTQVAVPLPQMSYTPQGGPGTNPNDQAANLAAISMQSTAWSANDHHATKTGGKTKRRKYYRIKKHKTKRYTNIIKKKYYKTNKHKK